MPAEVLYGPLSILVVLQGDLSVADGAPKESDKIAELRMGLDTMRKAVENYFGAVYTVARLMPTAERKEFLDSFKEDQ